MSRALKPKAVVKLLTEHGFVLARQRGSHALYEHIDGRRTVVPMHNRELPVGTLRAIFKQARIELP